MSRLLPDSLTPYLILVVQSLICALHSVLGAINEFEQKEPSQEDLGGPQSRSNEEANTFTEQGKHRASFLYRVFRYKIFIYVHDCALKYRSSIKP
jgi:hypothetical protein